MSIHLDAGDMLAQEAVDIGPEETAGELERRLAPLGARLALSVIGQIAAGSARGLPQDKSQVTRAPKLTKEHGLIDWTRSARQVCDQVRAMQPWPTAYTYYHRTGQPPVRLIIPRAAAAAEGETVDHRPGQLIRSQAGAEGALRVAAGDRTVVRVLTVQPAGKRPMSAAEFLRGHPLHAGDWLAPEPS
jgi:methionyl-tRNA formyltransferase